MNTRRLVLIAIGVLLLTATFAMANAVDRGVTRAWSIQARGAWVFVMLAFMLAGIWTALTGIGVVSSESLAAIGSGSTRAPSPLQHALVYIGIMLLIVPASILLQARYGIPFPNTLFVSCGAVFLLGGAARPWWLFATLRRLGWFAAIEDDSLMRGLLATIGLVLVVVGFLADLSGVSG
jgi:hypothetical protein